jgi:hypothetical protein
LLQSICETLDVDLVDLRVEMDLVGC